MKKIFPLLVFVMLLCSCEQNIQTNTPAFQAKLNNQPWRANQVSITSDINGGMTITAFTSQETVVLKTDSRNIGTYLLGTLNINNFASYTSTFNNQIDEYETSVVEGPVYKLSSLINNGTGYINSSAAQTTGGSGSGLRVAITTTAGNITNVSIVSRGLGYVAGDLITVVGGNNNATIRVENVQQSNGEITITDVTNGLYSGTFKLNAVNSEGEIVNFTEGYFYKVPLQ